MRAAPTVVVLSRPVGNGSFRNRLVDYDSWLIFSKNGEGSGRSVSLSADETGLARTIDVPGSVIGASYNREIKFLRANHP